MHAILKVSAIVCLLAPTSAPGLILIDNLDNHFEHLSGVVGMFEGDNTIMAGAFTTGLGSDIEFDQVTLHLGGDIGTVSDFTVELYDSNGGEPGSVIAQLDGSDNPIITGNHVYTTPVSIALTESTTYFIVASATSSDATGFYLWSETTVNSQTGVAGWSIEDTVYFSNGVDGWNPNNGLAPRFSVAGIPEPGEYALALGLCSVTLLLLRRRRAAS